MRRYPRFFDDRFPGQDRPRPGSAWPVPTRRDVAPAPELERDLELQEEPPPRPPVAVVPPDKDDRAALRDASTRLDEARARVERDAARVLDDTRGKLVEQLLPVLDSMDRSVDAGADPGAAQIRAQLETVLRGFGLEKFDAEIGGPFDPREHEAIAVIDVDDARAGTVTAQWQAGFRHAGRLLRPARVQVGRRRR